MVPASYLIIDEVQALPKMRGRESPAALDVSALNLSALNADVYRDMRWCPDCGGKQVFVEVFEFEGGRVGVCLGCGEERVVRFSRMVA